MPSTKNAERMTRMRDMRRPADSGRAPMSDRGYVRPALVRSRHAQHMLGDVGEDEIGGDRRDLKQTSLPPFPLDVVFAREAETAMTLHGGLAGMPRGF